MPPATWLAAPSPEISIGKSLSFLIERAIFFLDDISDNADMHIMAEMRGTSLSLSRETSARLDCYKFWLRRHAGKDYPSYSALIDDMLDKVLALDKDAKAFVSEHGYLF